MSQLYEPYFGSASAIYGIMLPHLSKRKERSAVEEKLYEVVIQEMGI
jgi:hypothetical protein